MQKKENNNVPSSPPKNLLENLLIRVDGNCFYRRLSMFFEHHEENYDYYRKKSLNI